MPLLKDQWNASIEDVQMALAKKMAEYRNIIRDVHKIASTEKSEESIQNAADTIAQIKEKYGIDLQEGCDTLDTFKGSNEKIDKTIEAIERKAQQYGNTLDRTLQRDQQANTRLEKAKATNNEEIVKSAWRNINNNFNRADEQLGNAGWDMVHIRPQTEADLEERRNILNDFTKKMQECDEHITFHGTSLHNAERILQTGGIVSSEDRVGYQMSYDVEGQVSVSTPATCEMSISSYANISQTTKCLPGGVVFVMNTKNEQEWEAAQSLLSENIHFNEPDRLNAILTTTENQKYLKDKFPEYSDKIQTFDHFSQQMELQQKNKEQIQNNSEGMKRERRIALGFEKNSNQNANPSYRQRENMGQQQQFARQQLKMAE